MLRIIETSRLQEAISARINAVWTLKEDILVNVAALLFVNCTFLYMNISLITLGLVLSVCPMFFVSSIKFVKCFCLLDVRA